MWQSVLFSGALDSLQLRTKCNFQENFRLRCLFLIFQMIKLLLVSFGGAFAAYLLPVQRLNIQHRCDCIM